MKIEIAKEGRMDMSGQGLIRAIQNNNMPILDLLVRESVQNSLDAAQSKTECVQVDFGVKQFKNKDLANELEGIKNSLLSQFGDTNCKYLFIRDSNTKGLTGPLHFTDKAKAEEKNLLKLVYEIAKPQEQKGAGGSWGYGKTIYFRIGIGLVIYYSRIRLDNGQYQSRLAACLVEDEKREDAMLSDPKLQSHRGLAWWGDEYSYNINGMLEIGTIPVTDEMEINSFLEKFGLEPFQNKETGTVIIIPYIEEKKLLSNNISTDGGTEIPWVDTIEDYLTIAIQRWYIGRLNNPIYEKKQKQPWLRITINGESLGRDDMDIPFIEIQKLYNLALSGNTTKKNIPMEEYHCAEIRINSFFKSPRAGCVAFKMFTPEELGMNPPTNNKSPFIYVNNEDGTDDFKDGDIILTYFRKPGMAVSYETAGEWVNKIKCNNEKTGDILIVVFVLNSGNFFDHSGIDELDTIEEYFRSSERADHTAWFDINVNDINPKLLDKIQKGIKNQVNKTFTVKEETELKKSQLSQVFGEYFLPPEGFGKKAKGKKSGKGGGGDVVTHKNIRLVVDNKSIHIDSNTMELPVTIEAGAPVAGKILSLEIASDGRNIPLSQWAEKTGTTVPFNIERLEIERIQSEKKTLGEELIINQINPEIEKKGYSIRLLGDDNNTHYGIRISSERPDIQLSGKLIIRLMDITAEMAYVFKDGE